MITIATLLWDPNRNSKSFSTMYSEVWVERLYRGFQRNLTIPMQFVLFTDYHRDLPEDIGQIIMPSVEYGYGDCIRPFGLGVPMILCGLDTVVTGNCDDLARYCLEARVMALPRDPYKPKIACTGVCLVPHGYAHVFATWHGQNDMDHMRAQEHVFIDSIFPGQVQSYKGHVERRGLGDTRICYFHGLKKPHELKADWINKHWKGE
jgi:hypothetical protein